MAKFYTMENQNLLYISNADVTVGIHVKMGGTIVYLSKSGSVNLLKENPTLWNESLPISNDTDFIPLQGHTIWVGPQSEWWNQQDSNANKKQEKSVWPPCPYITVGEYTVISQNEWSVKIQSQHSEIWGVTIEKEIAVNPDGSVFVQVTLINSSNEPKSWDIWHNTRIDGFNRTYVKTNQSNCKVAPVLNDVSTEMPFEFKDGYFTFLPEKPPIEYSERNSKAFIYPEEPVIYAFSKKHMLSISFEKHLQHEIHPEQGLVELYNHTEQNSSNALLELEYHSSYQTILPGDIMQAWEVWMIEEYNGKQTQEEHLHFIQTWLNE